MTWQLDATAVSALLDARETTPLRLLEQFLGRLDELGRRIRVDAGEQKHDLCGSLEPCQGAVEFHMYPRAYHGFYRATKARVTNQAERDNLVALRRFLHE